MDQYLHVFVTVVEKGNFSRAAEELHMTQPAVSQYIQTLERTVGARLLERTNKYVRLNKAGDAVYHHAKEILGLYTKMQRIVDDLTNKASGALSIGSSYTFGEYVLPHIMAKLQTGYPDIDPTITIANTKEIAELIANHQLDVGIVEGHFKEKNLIVEKLAEDSMVIVASTKLLNINKNHLEKDTWIVREPGSGTREAQESFFQKFNITPKKLMEFGSTQLIKESVEAGLGISLLSNWTIQKELILDSLQIIDIKGLPIKREFSVITKTPFQTKALEVFLDLLRKNTLIPLQK
ncbi:transcriptional regulator [Heyndrickxia shackletonii]|uniref:Transcriptional regulator n=1 Tax=Heyndrickxia shackletonii TaxID=157838 RepID=A0A0Q3WST2_9BACI|nr:LysR family transcriptional regulator [Heyndrickxia shackletonii]KQL52340.1 transcriptional regulator [Heyndrickxia shackletonii]NEZ01671.1 LysR family transcriptional regulator [Heyndrickxia shackletonii]